MGVMMVRGLPDGEVSLADLAALDAELEAVKARLDWVAGAFTLGMEGVDQVVAEVPYDGFSRERWRALCQVVGLALVASRCRPGWMWRVEEDDSLLADALRHSGEVWLQAGRVVRRRVGEPRQGLPAPDLDVALRVELAYGLRDEMAALGLEVPAGRPSRRAFLEQSRRAGWDAPSRGVSVEGPTGRGPEDGPVTVQWAALALVWGHGRWRDVEGRVHLHNTSDVLLPDVELHFAMRDREGRVLDVATQHVELLGPGEARELRVSASVLADPCRASSVDVWARVVTAVHVRGETDVAWEGA